MHVGSLHAADDEMALQTRATSTRAATRASASGWSAPTTITASSPDEKDPFFAPERRQGLPAPDVLRDPRERPAPVSEAPMNDARRVYDGLLDADGRRSHWAFGTGFDDPLAGVDTTVPDGVDRADLARVLPDARRRRADHVATARRSGAAARPSWKRTSRWPTSRWTCSARPGCCWPAPPPPTAVPACAARRPDEDALAFFRDDREFRNVRLAELPNGDFAHAIVRLLLFSTWRLALLDRLRDSRDPVLAAVAAKGVKELTYHRDYAARWALALGDGTDGVAPPDAGGAGRGVAARGRAVRAPPDVERRAAAAGVARRPGDARATRSTPCSTQVLRRSDARRARTPAARAPSAAGRAATACTPRRWAACSPRCRAVARAHPERRW